MASAVLQRISPPVHCGRVVRVDRTRDLINVRWLGTGEVLEFAIPEAGLALADDVWKSGQTEPASLPFAVKALALMVRKMARVLATIIIATIAITRMAAAGNPWPATEIAKLPQERVARIKEHCRHQWGDEGNYSMVVACET